MTVLVADDHPIYIEGLVNLLRSYDFDVVGSATDGKQAVQLAYEKKPDVVLMDANMPGMDGIEATREIRKTLTQTKVVILTGIEDDALLSKAMQAGASGFLLKRLDGESLHKNLLELQAGNNPFSPGLDDILHKSNEESLLQKNELECSYFTDRELHILQLLSKGKTYKEIGTEIHLSEAAVKYNVKKIKDQCGAQTQADLLTFYRNNSKGHDAL